MKRVGVVAWFVAAVVACRSTPVEPAPEPLATAGPASSATPCSRPGGGVRRDWSGEPKVADLEEYERACANCDVTACERQAWLLGRGLLGPGRQADAIPIADAACAHGGEDGCLFGLLLARRFQTSSVPARLAKACDGGDSTACERQAIALLATGDRAAAGKVWTAACRAGSDWACAVPVDDAPPATDVTIPDELRVALDAAGLVLEVPRGFVLEPYRKNPHLYYSIAMRATAARYEVRYWINPASRRPQGPMALQVNALNLSGGRDPDVQSFPAFAVRNEFDAEWGGVTSFPLTTGFNATYTTAILFGILRGGSGEANVVCLFDAFDDVRALHRAAFHALRFRDPVGLDAWGKGRP